jgi:Photosynthetic reaction centre cytochrome C subunit
MLLRRAIGFVVTSLTLVAVVMAVNPSRSADAPQNMTLMPTAAPVDSFVAERDSLMNQVLTAIAGREGAPAESVFKNIKILKGMPAGRVPRIMNMGFGKSLGVSCRHCHVPGHWADDDKPQKQIARDMWDMVGTINKQMLPNIKNLRSTQPTVNCTTCHRGAIKPALNL